MTYVVLLAPLVVAALIAVAVALGRIGPAVGRHGDEDASDTTPVQQLRGEAPAVGVHRLAPHRNVPEGAEDVARDGVPVLVGQRDLEQLVEIADAHAPVDGDDRPVEEAGRRQAEAERHLGDLLRVPVAAQRDATAPNWCSTPPGNLPTAIIGL